jgi:3-hydroxyisobutyrate dehydrogenase-like beta-hydroxyacid dehydrogenase
MGVSLAASAKNTGHRVLWASEGRSDQTRKRAEDNGLVDIGSLASMCAEAEAIVCVCPPHAAEEVARAVATQGFKGGYLDANAIAPERAIRIGETVTEGGATFVDGGIVGGPAWEPGKTWLYLSGEGAEEAVAWFSAGPLETSVIGESSCKASALKMCYAANTKGTSALTCAVLGAAEGLGVRQELEAQWSREGSDRVEKAQGTVRSVTAKAWRFEGEMGEIAATFESAGIPGGFHRAAGEVYRRISGFKDVEGKPALEEVLKALLQRG